MSDWIDELLVNFGRILQRNSPEAGDTVRAAYKYSKQAIASKLTEAERLARLDELKSLELNFGDGSDIDLYTILIDRIKALETQADRKKEK